MSFTAFSDTMTNTNSGYGGTANGTDVREVIPVASLSTAYKGMVTASIIIKSQTGTSGNLDGAYIGGTGGGANNVNFKGDQAQITWAGSASLALSGATTYTASDQSAPFFYDPAVALVISLHFSGTTDTAASSTSGIGANTNNYQLNTASQVGLTTPAGSYTGDAFYSWVQSVILTPATAGNLAMSRQYFMDTLADPPVANLSAVVATTETLLWLPAQYTPIAANDARPGKMYKVSAGGIISTAGSASTLIVTPRFGNSATVGTNITMGASGAQNMPLSMSNVAWYLEFMAVIRTVGAPGVNSTVMGTGFFTMAGVAGTIANTTSLPFGGTSATVDVSIGCGIAISTTLSVAGSITPMFACIQSLN